MYLVIAAMIIVVKAMNSADFMTRYGLNFINSNDLVFKSEANTAEPQLVVFSIRHGLFLWSQQRRFFRWFQITKRWQRGYFEFLFIWKIHKVRSTSKWTQGYLPLDICMKAAFYYQPQNALSYFLLLSWKQNIRQFASEQKTLKAL